MNALNINWLPARRGPSVLALALLAAGLAALLTALQNYNDAQDAREFQVSRQERAERLDRAERAQRTAHAPQLAASARRGGDGETLARMAAQLEVPWHPMLRALEKQALPEVALLQLDVSAPAHTVRLIAEAKSMDDALHYVSGLQHVRSLRNVALLSHEERVVGATTVLRITVSADWGDAHD